MSQGGVVDYANAGYDDPLDVAKEEFHDFRDRGDPLEKVHPDPRHWSRWQERENVDLPVPGL